MINHIFLGGIYNFIGIEIGISITPGWWLRHPYEKYARQLGSFFPTKWKVIKLMFQTTSQTIFRFPSIPSMKTTVKITINHRENHY